jgi:hypothetical protein
MDPKELLLRHFEKAIIAVCGLWLLWVAYVGVLGSPPELKMNVDLKATIDKIDTYMKTPSPELAKLEDPTADLRGQLDPLAVPPVEGFPAWLVHRRPNLAVAVAAGPQRVWPVHKAPTEFHVVEKGRGHVKLAWKQSGENEYVNITGYEIFRKDNDEKAEWKSLVANIDGNKGEYEDNSVGPRARYWYKLKESATAQTDNPVIVRDKTFLQPEQCDLMAEEIHEAVETPQDVYITIDGGEPTDPVSDKKGSIQCKVWRWSGGKFVSKNYTKIDAGAKIGAKEKVREGGKQVEVDFGTEAVLVDVKQEKRKTKTGIERETIIAHVKWPWGQEEELVEKEFPDEIAKQLGKPPK